MSSEYLSDLFSLDGKVAIVTGGTGVLGGAMAQALAQAGAKVGILGRRKEQADTIVGQIAAAGGEALPLLADVLDKGKLQAAHDTVMARWGQIDILVNAAGGNSPTAMTGPDQSFFDLPRDAMQSIIDLNLMGTMLPSQVFGAAMVKHHEGCIVNISSMAAIQAITRVVAYSAAKASIDNFTRWLAIELAQKYGRALRVNAIAPGFFLADKNRRLLVNEDGSLTTRGQAIISHTPAGQFGEPDELSSTLIWLCSPGARFISGVVIPVDGGFSAFSGV